MTKPIINNITIAGDTNKTPIKVALVGLTMIQQAILEFYFATQEGSEKFVEVLGKDADAYITNFDEQGAIDTWENLYAQGNKPTIVLSDSRKDDKNFHYFPKPLTPDLLQQAAQLIYSLLGLEDPDTEANKETVNINKINNLSSFESLLVSNEIEELSFNSAEQKQEDAIESAEPIEKATNNTTVERVDNDLDLINELSFSQIEEETAVNMESGIKDNIADFIDELSFSADAEGLGLVLEEKKEKVVENSSDEINSNELDLLDEFALDDALEEAISFSELAEDNEVSDTKLTDDSKNNSTEKQEVINKIDSQDTPSLEAISLSFDESDSQTTSLSAEEEGDKLTSADELQLFIDELSEKESAEEKKVQPSAPKKSEEQRRWAQLCGKYKNEDYKKETNTRFNIETTLLPFIADTISFTERAECWMELSYKPLSIIVNPDDQRVYSNLSLEDPLFVQICGRSIVEELIEFLEVDKEHMVKINKGELDDKLFSYDLRNFVWTTSLLVSHGRLPENCNPDDRISITNWLSLNKVEKFPYIMQIAAVFNQHHASLNEAASWMTLPKRYVYAFYNGVLALNMIDKNPKKANEKKLIEMGGNSGKNDNIFKNILFKKLI